MDEAARTTALATDDRAAPAAKARLTGIEAGRGLAATAVVLYHAARHLNRSVPAPWLTHLFQFGHAGVDFFFVISGFIIFHVHAVDIGRPSRLRHYGARRLTRVLPAYWVALALTMAMDAGGRPGLHSLGEIARSLVLLPSDAPPILGIAWTLQYEVVFYAVFAMLIVNRAIGAAVLVLWLGWIVIALAGGGSGIAPQSIYGVYNLEFFAGMASAYLLARRRITAPLGLLAAGVAMFACTAISEDFGALDGSSNYARLAYGLPSAAIVLGAAASDREGLLDVPAWLRTLGAASYSIYLFQFVFIGIGWHVLAATGADGALPVWASFGVYVAVAVGGGILMSRRVEYPLMRRLRSILDR